ncbi:hypothetical protein [Cohnella sp. GCM10012308]|uniref:hypothetical protein n=1 Tax=Cohnella sp. GCM10012308 TaxID=3317329 RepID=UPI00361CD11D
MIKCAEEFVRLRSSEKMDEYLKAAWDEASVEVWLDVINRYPDMRKWVAHNKTVPVVIMEILAVDVDERVRFMVASKNRLPEDLQLILAADISDSVRQRIVYNKKATLKVLSSLLKDDNEEIRSLAKHRIDGGRFK